MFCSACGATMQDGVCVVCAARPQMMVQARPVTDIGSRVGASLLDVIPAFIASLLLGWIPIIGAMMLGLVLCCYWLLRDVTGASLGKMLLGLVVVRKDGSPSGTGERILRNVPICIGPALLMIPVLGYVLAPPIAFILNATEFVLLLTKHERLGDMLAGTTVVKKDTAIRPV